MNPINSLVNLVNGLECSLMRDIFLNLQQDESATNEQLVEDSLRWDSYLSAYCAAYNKLNTNKFIQ